MAYETACCFRMLQQLTHHCPKHAVASDCPDNLIVVYPNGQHGLRIHDGGSASVLFTYCPWCGRQL